MPYAVVKECCHPEMTASKGGCCCVVCGEKEKLNTIDHAGAGIHERRDLATISQLLWCWEWKLCCHADHRERKAVTSKPPHCGFLCTRKCNFTDNGFGTANDLSLPFTSGVLQS